MKQAGSFFEFKLELAIRMYFLCIDFLVACQEVVPHSPWTVLPKISLLSVFESIQPQKKQPNACYYGDHQRKSASSGW